MVLVRAANYGQLEKLMSFSHLLLGVESELVERFMVVFSGFIALAKFVGVYRHWPVLIT